LPAIFKDLVKAGDSSFAAASAYSDWLMVYIEEAHAEDEWPISSGRYNGGRGPVKINQPKTAAERVDVARMFLKNFDIPTEDKMQCVVDNPEAGNQFEKAFAPWPLRIYVVEDSKMAYIAEPSDCTYDVSLLRDWLIARHSSGDGGGNSKSSHNTSNGNSNISSPGH